jgi:hypothetical protein
MREYIFHGKRVDSEGWAEGYLRVIEGVPQIYVPFTEEEKANQNIRLSAPLGGLCHIVVPESVGQYTGMTEFMLTDESRNVKLYEGDIVEVWGWRSVYGRNQSQYDKRVKVRGVIYFNSRGQWYINYDNKYNEALAELKGQETEKRQAHGAYELYYYGYHGSDIEKYRAKELEWHGKFHNKEDIVGHSDVVKIGTVFENVDLLEE